MILFIMDDEEGEQAGSDYLSAYRQYFISSKFNYTFSMCLSIQLIRRSALIEDKKRMAKSSKDGVSDEAVVKNTSHTNQNRTI